MHTHIAFLLSSNKNLNDNAVQDYFPDDYSNEIDEALCYLTKAYECAPTQLLQILLCLLLKQKC